jgi:hypothetical protein
MPLPPLLSEHPPAVRCVLAVVLPLVGGFLTGAMLGTTPALWAIANVLAFIGGLAGGFDHDGAAAGAKRGALGGVLFGVALVLADATVVDDRVATIADPPLLHPLITTTIGTLLGAAGGALRARAMRRQAAPASAG